MTKEISETSKKIIEFCCDCNAILLFPTGCDGIEVSSGIAEDGFWIFRGEFPYEIMKRDSFRIKKIPRVIRNSVKPLVKGQYESPTPYGLYNLDSAEKIKKQVNIPVIVVGGVRKIDEIEKIIEDNKSDVVGMARPFIIEPNIVNKFKEGKQTESRCINCNYCIIGVEERPLRCYYGKI